MNIIEEIKKTSIMQIISSLSGFLILLIGSLYLDVVPKIVQHLIPEVSKHVILKIGTLAIILFFLSILLSLILYLKLKVKLIPKYGMLWDKNKNAFCPSCKTHTSNYSTYKNPNFFCCICNSYFPLKTKTGEIISLDEIMKNSTLTL